MPEPTDQSVSSQPAEPVICVCGRRLRDPVSIARRTGPTCWRKLHGPTTRRPAIPRPDSGTTPIDGQTALDLQDHQPTLWSL